MSPIDIECSLQAYRFHLDWRMQLNNYLQANGGVRLLSWEVYQSGPLHQPSWTAIAYSGLLLLASSTSRQTLTPPLTVSGVEYGRAYGPSQSVVKEEAARQTLNALIADRRARGFA